MSPNKNFLSKTDGNSRKEESLLSQKQLLLRRLRAREMMELQTDGNSEKEETPPSQKQQLMRRLR